MHKSKSRVRKFLTSTRTLIGVGLLAVAVIIGGIVHLTQPKSAQHFRPGQEISLAAASVYTGKLVFCWYQFGNHIPTVWVYPYTCPGNDKEAIVNGTGPAGPQGVPGPQGTPGTNGTNGLAGSQGIQGPAGPSGVVAVSTHDLGGLASANSGGHFSTGATEVGTPLNVAAGTYLVCMNAKATAEAAPQAGTDTGISAQFFLYTQALGPSFAGDVLNASAPLQPDGTKHDSYASGCTLVTVPTGIGQSWHVYAFGYDSDSGSGNYVVDDVTLTLTQLTTPPA